MLRTLSTMWFTPTGATGRRPAASADAMSHLQISSPRRTAKHAVPARAAIIPDMIYRVRATTLICLLVRFSCSIVRGDATAMDVLSDVLKAVRLTGAIFFERHLHAPWVGESPDSAAI